MKRLKRLLPYNRTKKTISIYRKVLTNTVVFFLLFLIVSFFVNYFQAKSTLKKATAQDVAESNKRIEQLFETYVSLAHKNVAFFLSSSSSLNDFLSTTVQEQILYKVSLESELVKLEKIYSQALNRISIIDSQGLETVGVYKQKRNRDLKKISSIDKNIMSELRHLSESPRLERAIYSSQSQNILYTLKAIMDPDTLEFAGAILLEFNLEPLIAEIQNTNIGSLQIASARFGSQSISSVKSVETELVGNFNLSFLNNNKLANIAYKNNKSFVRKNFISIIVSNFLFNFSAFLVFLIMIALSLRELMSPISSLVLATKEIARERYDQEIESSKYSEINQLVKHFKKMRTQQSALVQEIKTQKNYLETIVANLGAGVVVLDKAETVIVFNDLAKEWFGVAPSINAQNNEYGEQKRLRSLSRALIEYTDLPGIRSLRGEECRGEHFMVYGENEDEITYLSANSRAIYDENGEIDAAVVAFHDISALVMAEQQLKSTQKLAAIGEMAAGIAHEINNPLAIISNHNENISFLVPKEIDTYQDIQSSCDKIFETIERMTKIATSMRNLSRSNIDEEFKLCTLHTIVEESMVICSEKFKNKGITICNEVDVNLKVDCRSGEMAQVIINLISNAADAIMSLEDRWIKIFSQENLNTVSIFVMDSGDGITENIRSKILNPFFTTKAEYKGTGLGLSIVNSIVHAHAGNISIDDTSVNTCFVITLPKVQSAKKVA